MEEYGFESYGAWTYDHNDFVKDGYIKPYVIELGLHATLPPKGTKGEFGDIFAPNFTKTIKSVIKEKVTPRVNDTTLVGYFIANEMFWGSFVDRWPVIFREDKTLLIYFLLLPDGTPGRKQATKFLKTRYHNNISTFNKQWGVHAKSFDSYKPKLPFLLPHTHRMNDYKAFATFTATYYFKLTTSLIKEADPNHLLMGVRYSYWEMPDEVLIAQRGFFDVTSYNGYEWFPGFSITKEVQKVYELTQTPVMISEFGFKAMESPYLNIIGAGFPLLTQKERGNAYRAYIQNLMSQRFMVGYVFWEWKDPPLYEKDHSNFGIIKIDDSEWTELVNAMKEVNPKAEAWHKDAN